ncbi:MAG: hypothetical protein M0R23_04095 [Bacteroidales bacterium]|nr:hypothetical protein [Bacteroidales bacterium]
MTLRKALLYIILILLSCPFLNAQKRNDRDSLVRLLAANSVQQVEIDGTNVRKVNGDVKFLHNDTYLICDSAYWNVNMEYIEAFGSVKIIQEGTMIKSDKLIYLINQNIARFRGSIVELIDKEQNILRTKFLDYNTKDSVATFVAGASMKDKDGNVIESERGTYDSKINTFIFEENVNMYTDSIFIKTTTLKYITDLQKAWFGKKTFMWRDDGFMYANAGWYDRSQDIVNYSNNVYINTPNYEIWANEVYYYRPVGKVELYKNVQILDTNHKVIFFADKAEYDRDSSYASLTDNPSIIYYGQNENDKPDSLFVSADTLSCYTKRKCDIPASEIVEAKKRKLDALFDAIEEGRRKREDEKKEEQVRDNQAMQRKQGPQGKQSSPVNSLSDSIFVVPVDTTVAYADSSKVSIIDTTLVDTIFIKDSVIINLPDTTQIRYIQAYHNVKLYRSDLQAICDSMIFTELDSIARLFERPVLWNNIKNQLSSDVMQLLMQNGALSRGNLINNAMILTKEDEEHFNQIKSTEMVGFFRDNQLYRYDALGGVNAIFYLLEDNNITTVNMKEAKTLTSFIKDGTAEKMIYLEEVKSDAYPVFKLDMEKQRLKGFKWRGSERPANRDSVTSRSIYQSCRKAFSSTKKPNYPITNTYFEGYMNEVYGRIREKKDSVLIKDAIDTLARNKDADTTIIKSDANNVELNIIDEKRPQLDSLAHKNILITPEGDDVEKNTVQSVIHNKKLTCREKRAIRKAERDKKKIEKQMKAYDRDKKK